MRVIGFPSLILRLGKDRDGAPKGRSFSRDLAIFFFFFFIFFFYFFFYFFFFVVFFFLRALPGFETPCRLLRDLGFWEIGLAGTLALPGWCRIVQRRNTRPAVGLVQLSVAKFHRRAARATVFWQIGSLSFNYPLQIKAMVAFVRVLPLLCAYFLRQNRGLYQFWFEIALFHRRLNYGSTPSPRPNGFPSPPRYSFPIGALALRAQWSPNGGEGEGMVQLRTGSSIIPQSTPAARRSGVAPQNWSNKRRGGSSGLAGWLAGRRWWS